VSGKIWSSSVPRTSSKALEFLAALRADRRSESIGNGDKKGQTMLSILPQPTKANARPGKLELALPLTMTGGPGTQATLQYVHLLLGDHARFVPEPAALLRLDLDGSLSAELGDEGYALDVTPGGIHIRAPWSAGLFYGVQTLRHLLPADAAAGSPERHTLVLPCVSIRDKPHYAWRGFMLDEARHFFGATTVKRILDWMACFKLNRFHWHLTDDQGWRVEIRQYPRLTEIGGRRAGTQVGSFLPRRATIDDTPHEGWYTQRQIRDIIAYAAARHITIVPEFDLPGHFGAALAAYPKLGCAERPEGARAEVRRRWGIFSDVACVGNPQTLAFMRDVLDELCTLFPGRYLHLGGDAVKTDHWQACPHCRRVKRRYGYADWADLTTHTMNVLAVHLRRRDKTAVVWNEALRPSLSKDVVVMHWRPGRRSMRGTKQALRDGYQVVFQTWLESYYDYPYTMVPLRSVYRAHSLDDVTLAMAAHVLGVQGGLWTEFVAGETRIQFNVFPRLAAKAEVGWTGPPAKGSHSPRDSHLRRYADFKQRWQAVQPHVVQMGLTGAAPLAASDPGPVRQFWGLLRDLRRGDLQAEQRRWTKG
jgi:hexosaminidase